jgi:hypothetical protein
MRIILYTKKSSLPIKKGSVPLRYTTFNMGFFCIGSSRYVFVAVLSQFAKFSAVLPPLSAACYLPPYCRS